MNTRIRKRRAPQRQLSGSRRAVPDGPQYDALSMQRYQLDVGPLRRSARQRSKQHSLSISHSLKRWSEAPQASQINLPNSSSIAEPTASGAKLQDLSQIDVHLTRKRRAGEYIDNSSERPSKRVCLADLTERNLKAFNKIEKMRRKSNRERKPSSPSETKSSLPGSKSSHSKSKSLPSDESKASRKTVSTTDPSFARLAFENGVLDPVNSLAPLRLDQGQNQLDRERDTESPTESEYNDFSYRVQKAPNEMSMLLETSTLLKGYSRGYRRVYNQALSDFPKNIGFNNGLSAAQPDMVEGLDLTQFNPILRQTLGGATVPYLERDPLALSHIAGEWKGPGKDMICAETQAAYDGACLVYGRNKARSFLGNPDPPGHAFVSTFTTDGTTLNTYAHYSSESKGSVRYHQYPTSTSLLRSSYEGFKTARRRLRNAQDLAKENSEKLRDELEEKWTGSRQHVFEEDDEDDGDDQNKDDGIFSLPEAEDTHVETADQQNFEHYDDGKKDDGKDDPSCQLLTEYYASVTNHETEEESYVQVPTPDASSSESKRRSKYKKKKRSR